MEIVVEPMERAGVTYIWVRSTLGVRDIMRSSPVARLAVDQWVSRHAPQPASGAINSSARRMHLAVPRGPFSGQKVTGGKDGKELIDIERTPGAADWPGPM